MKGGGKLIIDKLIIPRMKEFGWSENRLALESGISQSQVNHWLAGKGDITLGKFFKILQALKVNPLFKTMDEDPIYVYKVERSGDEWKCINRDAGFFITWKTGHFNDAVVRWYEDHTQDVSDLARLMRLMGDFLVLHHNEKL